jgi:hypothetical protein
MPPKVRDFLIGVKGLNNKLNSERLQQGTRENGYLVEVAQASNVSIDDRYQLSSRTGYTAVDTGVFHSAFCDGGDCFVVEDLVADSSILKVNTNLTFTPVVTDITKGARVEFKQVNTDTFWSNGTEKGYIRAGVNYTWPLGTYRGPDTDAEFANAVPTPNHMAFRRGGQCALSVSQVVYLNHLPFQYGLFSLSKGVILFGSKVTMLAGTTEGFFISDQQHTWFFRNTGSWYGFKQELADKAPVMEWSNAHNRVLLRDIGIDAAGEGHVWRSTEGVCVGTEDGRVINFTDEMVEGAVAQTYAATLLKDEVAVTTVF